MHQYVKEESQEIVLSYFKAWKDVMSDGTI